MNDVHCRVSLVSTGELESRDAVMTTLNVCLSPRIHVCKLLYAAADMHKMVVISTSACMSFSSALRYRLYVETSLALSLVHRAFAAVAAVRVTLCPSWLWSRFST